MVDDLDHLRSLAKKLKNYRAPGSGDTSVDELHPFDTRNIHPKVAKVSVNLFDDGHFSQATFEAFKLVDKTVEAISEITDTGRSLMMAAFKTESPKIFLNSLSSSSDLNQQEGYKHIFAGAIVGIRNPRGHDVQVTESVEYCLDHLSLASHLMRMLDDRYLPTIEEKS